MKHEKVDFCVNAYDLNIKSNFKLPSYQLPCLQKICNRKKDFFKTQFAPATA